jgi:dihydroorotate dehydrogenase electron transfer subunit
MFDTIATAESNRELAPGYRVLTLNLTQDVSVKPGQFAMLKPHLTLEPLLRRALAVYKVDGPRRLSFLYQVLGRGTVALAQLRENDEVEALLPLGNSWSIDTAAGGGALVVAGGIGSASLLMLCEELKRLRVDTKLLFGAATESDSLGCGLEDFQTLALPSVVTTDDGSLGDKGFVTAPLERELRERDHQASTIYACGPWPMMKRVAEIAAQFQVRCRVSLEAPMGCGFGVCVGCVVAVNTGASLDYGSYKRVCTDGSIFPAETIRWEVNAMTH